VVAEGAHLVGNHLVGNHLVGFIEVMRRLRAECPWKAEQTHRSLARYLLEETHETLEAIDSGDADHLREELGDLLLQIYFHAAIASEAGEFTIDDNPHVFGPGQSEPTAALTSAQVNDQWQREKADEKQRSSLTDGLPPGLPALLYADKVLDRLSRSGVKARSDHTSNSDGELGERLLDLVREARAEGVDPEQALRDAVRREIAAAEG
jgi:XTP/dITP diphosphohydrolase